MRISLINYAIKTELTAYTRRFDYIEQLENIFIKAFSFLDFRRGVGEKIFSDMTRLICLILIFLAKISILHIDPSEYFGIKIFQNSEVLKNIFFEKILKMTCRF